MREFKFLAALLALVFTALMVLPQPQTASAAPDDGLNVSQFCTAFNDFGATHGECVSHFAKYNGNATGVEICKDLKELAEYLPPFMGRFIFPFKNLGQCVSTAAHYMN